MPSTKTSPETIKQIRDLYHKQKLNKTQIAAQLGINRSTVQTYLPIRGNLETVIPEPESELGESFESKPAVDFPASVDIPDAQFTINDSGWWWCLSDVHIPFHDKPAIELGAGKAAQREVAGIILNGDILDCMGLSSKFQKRPDGHTFKLERERGKQFLAWLRSKFPDARIIYKEGNHEERLLHFLADKAKELFDLEELQLSSLLDFAEYGVEFVNEQSLINLGKLCILHGHELSRGIAAPVNPARGAFLRANHTIMIGHHHQSSEHHARDVRGKSIIAWGLGCNCHLRPRYSRFNNWNHGGAFIDVAGDGTFNVQNYKIINGVVTGC